jgi:hypothetical protein
LRKTRLALVLVSGTLALAPGFAAAANESSAIEQLAIDTAQTTAEHAAVAGYFRAKAAEARAEARRHRSFANTYVGGKGAQRASFQLRHRNLAEDLEAMAMEYEEMARMHDEEAAKAS